MTDLLIFILNVTVGVVISQFGVWLGRRLERNRIIRIIVGQPTALEFFEPYIATDQLLQRIQKGNK